MAEQISTISASAKATADRPKGWKETTLGKVAEIIGGGTPKTDIAEYWNGDIPWLSVTDFNNDSRWVYETEKHITKQGLENSATKLLDAGDLIISARGTVGAFAQLKIPMAFNQSCYGLRAKEDTANDFLFYLLKQNIQQIKKNVHGAVFNTITRDIFDQIEFLLPPLPEQRAIAAVLSSLDDKIELLREQNKTLEATAQAVFKEWFVNFNFPDVTGTMIDSELGKIPEGWEVGTVSDVIERFSITYRCVQDDLSPKGKTPILDQGSNGLYGYTEREPDFQASTENPVIIFTNHTCNMWFMNYSFCAIQNVIPFRGNAEYSTFFVFYMTLGQIKFIEYKGHWPDFEQRKYVIPKPEIANKFAEIVKPLQYKIWNNNSEIQTLSKLRDTLLPKLMSGEIRVKQST